MLINEIIFSLKMHMGRGVWAIGKCPRFIRNIRAPAAAPLAPLLMMAAILDIPEAGRVPLPRKYAFRFSNYKEIRKYLGLILWLDSAERSITWIQWIVYIRIGRVVGPEVRSGTAREKGSEKSAQQQQWGGGCGWSGGRGRFFQSHENVASG